MKEKRSERKNQKTKKKQKRKTMLKRRRGTMIKVEWRKIKKKKLKIERRIARKDK